ncbi:thioredoxin-like-domain-containing protein [Thamnocephalis sphaerospora]|uniref:Thioredoxin-like-domain-containing protein n=1 Tax=Thamnocephalis sphaerospora TaxID=78915 RepID=A0A4P9XQ06_9FUNG|nr:thioredoxin-like-domain-containing protein [Thamnocephalis sphaerospora]|eukprot:RKP07541.1 thioredoxin-like-domain-containing protein [Thamnocephalis sphaerospora]
MADPVCEGDACRLPSSTDKLPLVEDEHSEKTEAEQAYSDDDEQPLGLRSAQPTSDILTALLRGGLLDYQGQPVPATSPLYASNGRPRPLLGVYFTASWCPPCQQFSPVLLRFTQQHADDLQIILVSHDRDEDAAAEYLSNKLGWMTLPFDDVDRRRTLARLFEVQMIPTLAIVDADTGKIVSTWGRSAIMKNPDGCLEEWRQGGTGVSWWQLIRPW